MPFWPFKKTEPESLSPDELRDKLTDTAAAGSKRKLRSFCNQYKNEITKHVDFICKAPEGMATDDVSINRYVQCLGAVAQCLANECNAPELWNKLIGTPDDNPLLQWDQWIDELPQRMERLDYNALIDEARGFIDKAKTLRGGTARQHEALLNGRLGELLFHSGRVSEAVEPFLSALELCYEINDTEGQVAYLNNLLEAHCYLDDGFAVQTAEQVLNLRKEIGLPTQDLQKRIERLRNGEPLCRVVCVRDGHQLELNEITSTGEGHYEFQFRRNRLSLHKCTTLTNQGCQLASAGGLSDALEKFQEACEVDPHDPDPVYQSGMCLLELGAYAKGREAFEEVERLAPGWFRCRSDRWLAEGLDSGTISDEEFRLIRALDDGGLPPAQATALVQQAVERFPELAPLYLFLGNHSRDERDAIAAYRKGLDLVDEPDLESRLLCALAGRISADAPERMQLVERAVSLNGSLVAVATAKLLGLQ